MENRVKERLTGAIILVAAMVILVPEMFSGQRARAVAPASLPPRPASEGPPLRSYTMDLDAHRANGTATSADQSSLAAGTATPEAPGAPATAPSAPAAGEQVSARPAPAQLPRVAPAPAPALTPQPASTGSWYVQVGSFSQAANAQRYAQELTRKGFATRVDPGKGKLLRVRVGPVADRAAAVQLQSQLAAQGHKGTPTSQ